MSEKKMKQNAYYHKIFYKFPFSRKSILYVFKSFQYIYGCAARIVFQLGNYMNGPIFSEFGK